MTLALLALYLLGAAREWYQDRRDGASARRRLAWALAWPLAAPLLEWRGRRCP